VNNIKGSERKIRIGLIMAFTTPRAMLVRKMLIKVWK
jgi:hypothetical protein